MVKSFEARMSRFPMTAMTRDVGDAGDLLIPPLGRLTWLD
jgi:hypothetical protein